ncbi:MAG: hypothetical protein RRB22_05895 [Gammaproteobacteria bacterium]|nr:hypothetical protein [Gammaproteobacteria bacterium]
MARKPKKSAKPEAVKYPRKAIPINAGKTKEETSRNFAELLTSPELAAFRVIDRAEQKSGLEDNIDVPTLLGTLRDQATAVNLGDLAQAEAMLMNQATALQSLFCRLAGRAMGNDTITPFEANMRMALRAQSQCRATLETLSAIKNPPIVYAKQANIAQGHQQVNNGTMEPSRAREIKNEQNQLSEADNELLPDARTSGNEIEANPTLETLGEIDRAKVRRG